MLTYTPIGPMPEGSYAVGYPTPGCSVMTVVSSGMTMERAQEEAARLNEDQEKRAAAIERECQASAMIPARSVTSEVRHPFRLSGTPQ
ncbi:hypothetical protein FEE59_22170 [Herbaspirillum sp. RU 5E]|nr:hypothetical protein [Herbaspirillum sp. RU 5E]